MFKILLGIEHILTRLFAPKKKSSLDRLRIIKREINNA